MKRVVNYIWQVCIDRMSLWWFFPCGWCEYLGWNVQSQRYFSDQNRCCCIAGSSSIPYAFVEKRILTLGKVICNMKAFFTCPKHQQNKQKQRWLPSIEERWMLGMNFIVARSHRIHAFKSNVPVSKMVLVSITILSFSFLVITLKYYVMMIFSFKASIASSHSTSKECF